MTYGKLVLICATVVGYGFEQCAGPVIRAAVEQETERLRLLIILELKSLRRELPPAEKPSIEIVPGTEKLRYRLNYFDASLGHNLPKVRDREAAITSTRAACAPRPEVARESVNRS